MSVFRETESRHISVIHKFGSLFPIRASCGCVGLAL